MRSNKVQLKFKSISNVDCQSRVVMVVNRGFRVKCYPQSIFPDVSECMESDTRRDFRFKVHNLTSMSVNREGATRRAVMYVYYYVSRFWRRVSQTCMARVELCAISGMVVESAFPPGARYANNAAATHWRPSKSRRNQNLHYSVLIKGKAKPSFCFITTLYRHSMKSTPLRRL